MSASFGMPAITGCDGSVVDAHHRSTGEELLPRQAVQHVLHRQLELIDRGDGAAAHRDQRAAGANERIQRLDARLVFRGRRGRAAEAAAGQDAARFIADQQHVDAILQVPA